MLNVRRTMALSLIGLVTALAACTKSNPEAPVADANAPAPVVAEGGATPAPGFAAPTAKADPNAPVAPGAAPVTPFRTFITLQRYTLEKSGNNPNGISNVRLEITFPNGGKMNLPEGGQYWPIGDGQVQEIGRTYEIPWAYIQKDGFKFSVQMVRKGSPMLPCNFEVAQLSEFNRSYVCKTDLGWQTTQGIREDKMAVEGMQVRVFTDKNSPANEVPKEAMVTTNK